ncbi:MAG: serine/threonine protein kinase [Deltaproteobacteria bacterium]|nr:MAG: serine/threonine protein kinase [Deltaproteobacteria bacterium]
MNLVPGTFVERYRVEVEIGRGGMARVYRVRHKNLDSVHALKVLTVSGEELAERFMREGRVQSRLDHPNIVPVRDVLEVGQGFGLLMDYVEGPSLDAWILDRRPDRAERERVFLEILVGVEFAHSEGIVHRDLKPGNVLMERRGKTWHPRIADFGLAKILGGEEDSASESRTGRPMGTPAYMSPEQVRCSKHVDHRTDVFALGCILYELMCDRRAFTGEDTLEVFNRVTQGRFRAPRELVEGLPARIEQAMLGALQIDLEARIPNCATLYQVFTGEQSWSILPRDNATLFGFDDPVDAVATPDRPGELAAPAEPSVEPPVQSAGEQAAQTMTFSGSVTFHPAAEADDEPPPRAWISPGSAAALVGLVFLLSCGGWLLWSGALPGPRVAAPPAFTEAPADPAPPPPSLQPSTVEAGPPTAEAEPPTVEAEPPTVEAEPPTAEAEPEVPPPPPHPESVGGPDRPAPDPAPAIAASPARAPTVGSSSRHGLVRFSGDARSVRLRGADGRYADEGEVPPGSYLIEARFDAGPPLHAGNVVVRAGDVLKLDCRAETLSCSR